MRILLVEDNSDHRELMRLALIEHDATFQVEGVVSGEEALCHLAEGKAYDVVFLDFSLPGRDGLEVLEEIRRGEAPPPVVMVTGRGDERLAVEAMKGGAYDYVVKGEGYLQRLPVVARHALEAQQLAVERNRTEEALRVSLEKYRVLFESFPLGITISDKSGKIIEGNRQSEKLLGITREAQAQRRIDSKEWQIIRKDGTPMPADEYASTRALRENRLIENVEMGIVKDKGEITWISVTAAPIPLEGYGVAITYSDITDRKQAEEKVRASLKEKEILLQEIHHRVKNNLQLISSLLGLQSRYLEDEKAREIVQESQNRVRVMAKIHTMLYQSGDLSRVDFGCFIRDLTGRLQQSYGIAGSPIEVHIDMADLSLSIETSIPCGLILNELVSNALRHAFPEGRGGEVNISMTKAGDRFVLKVQDNGIGFPKAVDFQNLQTLGLELVRILVEQINGTIDLMVEGGTTFTITFPAVSKGG